MPLIYNASPGSAVVIPESADYLPFVPFTLRVNKYKSAADLFEPVEYLKLATTQIGVNARVNAALLHSLRKTVFVYIFGDRVSDLAIGGIGFPDVCFGGSILSHIGTGFEWALHLFENAKLSAEGLPVIVTIGTTLSYVALLMGASVKIIDPATGLALYNLEFNFLPHSLTVPPGVPGNPIGGGIPGDGDEDDTPPGLGLGIGTGFTGGDGDEDDDITPVTIGAGPSPGTPGGGPGGTTPGGGDVGTVGDPFLGGAGYGVTASSSGYGVTVQEG